MRAFPILLAAALAGSAWATEASKLYDQGRKAEKAGQVTRAYLLYSEAAALEPSNHLYWSRTLALQTRAALEGKLTPPVAAALAQSTSEPDSKPKKPLPKIPAVTVQDLAEAREPLPPTRLNAALGLKDFDLRGNAKTLFETVAHAYGLDCVFDGDYRATEPLRFQMTEVNYRQALHAMEAVTGSFIVPVSGKLFLVVKDTPLKRVEEEPYASVVVPLTEPTTVQELTGLITAVQQVSGIRRVAWDSQKNIVVLRDTVSKVLPARQLFEDLMHPKAQVMFDVDFLEVSRNDMLQYGLSLPSAFPLASFSTFMNNVPKIPTNIAGMLGIGGGAGLIGVGIADMQLLASFSRSDTRILFHASVRSVDGQEATLHIGEKYPILTAGYYGPASFGGAGAYTPPPSFTFEDLGLSLKVKPSVHGTNEVTVSIDAEYKALGGTALNGIPVITNRSLKSEISLTMGETAVVAGLIADQDARTIAGIAGLSSLPVIGPLTRTTTHNKSGEEVLVLVRPTLLTPPPDNSMTHVYRMGSETRPLTQM